MQIVICDDTSYEREILKKYIELYAKKIHLDYEIKEFSSAVTLLDAFTKQTISPDIIFMDIYMENINGMDAIKQIFSSGFECCVIFITSSTEHAVESYKIMADGYICKPYEAEELERNLERSLKKCSQNLKSVSFTSNRLEYNIFLKDISCFESGGRCTYVYANGEKIKTTKTLAQFIEEIHDEKTFLRCHQGFLINLNYVKNFDNGGIYLTTGQKVLVRIRGKKQIEQALTDYFWSKMRD